MFSAQPLQMNDSEFGDFEQMCQILTTSQNGQVFWI